jgi:peptide chain release factor subunit 1
MPFDEMLKRLVTVTPGKKSILSVYLDLRPDGTGKKLYPVYLRNRIPDLFNFLPSSSPSQSLLVQDLKRVQKYLEEKLNPSWKGLALFACAPLDLFLPIPLLTPPENALVLDSIPHIFSLVRQEKLYEPYGLLIAGSRYARIFFLRSGQIDKRLDISWEEKHSTRFGRMGLSLPRFKRHLQEHLKRRAKEIVEKLDQWNPRGKMKYLFLIAEEGMEAELKKQIPSPWRKILFPLSSGDVHDPDHAILSLAADAIQEISRQEAETFAKRILEEETPKGEATSGPEPTLNALQTHQAERLVLDARFRAMGWRCGACHFLGIGGIPQGCPVCQGPILAADLREGIAHRAKSQGIDLLFTQDYPPLLSAGGIASGLKYKTAGAQKK